MKLEKLQVEIIIQKSSVQIRGRLPEFLVALECNVVGTDGEVVRKNFLEPIRHRVLLGTISSGSRGTFLSIRRNYDRHNYKLSHKFKTDSIRLYKNIDARRRKTAAERKALKILANAVTVRIAPHYPRMFEQCQIEEFMDEIQKSFFVSDVMES